MLRKYIDLDLPKPGGWYSSLSSSCEEDEVSGAFTSPFATVLDRLGGYIVGFLVVKFLAERGTLLCHTVTLPERFLVPREDNCPTLAMNALFR